MSTTTGLDLLAHADLLTRQLRRTTQPVTPEQWNTFDGTVHRLLLEIAGLNAFHVRPGDPSRAAMHLALRSYPQPLRAPVDASLTPEQAAPFLGYRARTVRTHVKNGRLRASVEDGQYRIHAADLPDQADVHPGDPADPHPLAKVSCALGALADLLHHARDDATPILEHRGEIAGATIHVLSLTAVAARHTLAYGPLDDATRPVLVARYAEQAIDRLRDVAQRPASLQDVTAVAWQPTTGTPVERLEVALHRWVRATEHELDQMIPSVDVIRQIANQGGHLCAVAAGVEADVDSALPDRDQLLTTGASLKAGEHAWRNLTTLTRPSHEFVTASRDLYEALHTIGTALQQGNPDLDMRLVGDALARGLRHIGELSATTRRLPETFLNAGVLFAPATALPPNDERVSARLHRHHVPVNYTDVPDLVDLWDQTCAAAEGVSRRVPARTPQLTVVSRSTP